MKKTAAQIADAVLEKVALRRGARELLKELERIPGLEGITKWFMKARKTRALVGGRPVPNNLLTSLRTDASQFGGSPKQLAAEFLAHKNVVPEGGFNRIYRQLEDLKLSTPRGAQDAELALSGSTDDLRTLISHRHGPRKDEVLIPAASGATGSAFVGDRDVVPSVLFRGNPRPEGSVMYTSRHPDVAARYAIDHPDLRNPLKLPPREGSVESRMTPSSGVLYAYSNKRVPDVGEVPMSMYKERALTAGKEEAKEKANLMYRYFLSGDAPTTRSFKLNVQHAGAANPTYEKLIPRGVNPELLGAYIPRLSRTPQGAPAIALKRIAGEPAEEVFKDYIGKTSPLFDDFR